MEQGLKERLVGAAVLVAIAVWLIPWVLDGPDGSTEAPPSSLQLPSAEEPMPMRTQTLRFDVAADLRAHQLDATAWPAQAARFEEVFATRTRAEWVEVFSRLDACVAPVLSATEAAADPHLVSRGTYRVGASGGPTHPGVVPRFTRTPGQAGDELVEPGSQTRDVLSELGWE